MPQVLFTAISRQGVLFIWPVRLSGDDDGIDAWNDSEVEYWWLRVPSHYPISVLFDMIFPIRI